MPIKAYFKGHGAEVMRSIRRAHPGASPEKVKAEFYATANARGMKPKSAKAKRAPKRRTSGFVPGRTRF